MLLASQWGDAWGACHCPQVLAGPWWGRGMRRTLICSSGRSRTKGGNCRGQSQHRGGRTFQHSRTGHHGERIPLKRAEDGRVQGRLEPTLPVDREVGAGVCRGSKAPSGTVALLPTAGPKLGLDMRQPWPARVQNEVTSPPPICLGFRVLICEIITSQGCKDQMRLDV